MVPSTSLDIHHSEPYFYSKLYKNNAVEETREASGNVGLFKTNLCRITVVKY
jgi:hypothetical protein